MSFLTSLSLQQRKIVGIVGLVFFVLYVVWMQSIQEKKQELAEKKSTYAWMQRIHHESKPARQKVNESQLLAIMSEELKQTSFKQFPFDIQQTGANLVQLSFARVPYTEAIAWLWALMNHYQLTILQWTADKTNDSGVVKMSITFSV